MTQEVRTNFDDDDDGTIDRTAFDPDGDGTADRIDHYTYDDDGARRVIRRDFDLDDDGTINRTAHLNAQGRWERVDLDADDDGNIDRSDHYTFAADGARSLTRTDFDTDGDGRTDRSETYTYNSDGALIRTAFDDDNDGAIDRTAIDPDGDGTADRIDHYTSDDDGARRVIRRDFDLDDDGTINRTAHLNAEGRWERVDLDADDDGNIDRSDHYTFAADGARSLTRTDFDTDGDGTADRSETYTYNSDGALIRTAFDDDADGAIDRTAFDPDGDGTADRIDHYTSDDDGARRVIRRDFDLDDDGTINRTAHLNAEGRWERVDLDADDDGNIDRSDHYTFAADGARSLTRTDFDTDGDGTADRSETYTYNSDGALIRTAFDDDADGAIDRTAIDPDGDGTADRIDHYTSDDDGARRVIRRNFDLDDDGTINRTAHLNAEGRWERVDLDADDDGNIDRSDRYTFAADGARSLTRTDFDVDDDGTADRSETYTYNSDGALIRTNFDDDADGAIDRTAFDPDGDGIADRIDHYTYDDDGARRVIRRDFDLDDDGTINRTAHLNADGRWERVDLDADGDGNIDRSDRYTFAADGARSLTRTDFDVDDDGTADRTETYTYNSDGALIRTNFDDDADGAIDRTAFDPDGDGIADRIDHYTYDDDGARRVIRRDFDLDDDGTINRTAHLNADGRWERVDLDADGDGNIDRSDRYTFAADGARSLTRTDFDVDDDGTADRTETYTYNSDGALIRTNFDDNNDGAIDRTAFDPDGDGTADRIDHHTSDDDGARRVIRRDFDLDDDGTINRTAHLNAQGRWERVDLDTDDDGNIDRSDRYTFAADGARSLTRTDFDVDDDGTTDRSETYTYNSDGALIRTNFDDNNDGAIDRTAFDPDGDGTADRIDHHTSDDDGARRVIRRDFDLDDDGTINRTAHLNAEGRWERVDLDTDDDGNIDRSDHYTFAADGARSLTRTETYTYNLDGTLIRTNFDDDADGNIDRAALDTDGDGTADRSETYFYTNSRRTRTEFDDDADGNIDRVRVAENQVAAYEAAADADGGPLSYSLSGTDAALFTIDANTGAVSFRAAPDFEAPGDADGDNVYDIIVTASDGVNSTEQPVAITVTNENDNVPVFTSPATARVAENQVAAYEAAATDADGDPLSYSLSGTDAALFTIDANTGAVSFRAAPDFEAPGDADGDNVYDIIVTASDGANSTEQPVAITVTNENDNPPAFTSPATARVAENQVAAYKAAAADADGDPLSYSLSGTDAALFTIEANTGVVSFRSAPDFEAPGDADGDNVYDIIVTASNGANSTDQPVAITVTNENDNAPAFTSPATARVAENQVAAYEAAAADADGGPLSYSLSGTDAALFTIDANTGAVSFRAAPDFEAPGDADGDNVYDIIVWASDDTNITNQNVAITVTNENDNPPAFTSPATVRVAENRVAAYEAAATDADGDPLSYSLSGTDAALFTIDANTGAVSFRAAPDFEVSGDDDGDNVYDIIVWASDDTNITNQNVAITVTNENDNPPAFTSPATVRVAENRVAAYEAAATDADGDPLSYSLSGTDAALFTIDANTGAVSFSAAPDFEAPGDADGDNVYDIIVTASDGANSTEQPVAITVTNENDNPPAFTSPATVRVAENQVAAYEAAAADADGGPLSYSLSGTDAALFTIDANTGAVSFRAAPDFEAPGDADGDNVYDIIVTASDGANSTDQNVAITVTNDNVPAFTSPATVSVAENQVAAYEAAAADADGGPLSYSLSGTDAALFTIDANTGEVSFRAAPDFEVPGDADGDNVYDIIVTASDGANSTEQPVAITVTNENDNVPAFTSPATVSVAENQVAAYEAAAADADGGPLSYSLSGTDAALFTIDADTGVVSFRAAPDFEVPGDDDGDNVYDIIVTASDGTNSTDQPVAITVKDEYEPIPLSSLDGTNGFILNGIDARDQSGRSVSSAGDVNGDGYDDLIIGADRADPNGDSSGETYVVYGGASAPGTDGVLDLSTLDGTNGFILNGISELDDSGNSVSSAGDVNGDGYDDLIIGASGVGSVQGEYERLPGPGEAYVVYGGPTGADLVLDRSTLDGTLGFALTGIDARDQSGRSVSSAGDVNGDGYDDLIISANEASPNGDNRVGETYVIYGGVGAPGTDGVLDLSTLDGTNGFILNGIDADDLSGWSVSSAGDVNGDGYDDLIIGAREADPNGGDEGGETYVVYGGASAPGTGGRFNLSKLDGTNGFILNGIDALDYSGRSVSSAGDVNGDGYDDMIIGGPGADPNGGDEGGETYVVYGGASAPGTGGRFNLSALDGTNGFILNGIDEDDLSGWSVSSAGDVNGDGYDDLIIGARDADPNEDSAAGEIYVVYGGANAPGTGGELDLSALDGTNGFILTGVDMFDNAGLSVSSAGDVNGDGYDDLIIGASGADPNGDSNAGETYVVYGGATGTESLVPVTTQGTAAVDNFTGNAGADSFTGIATDDVVRGGAGDDKTSVTALDFAAVDGGTGRDTLILDGSGLSLDLTGAGHASVDSVEVFDLSDTGSNTLVLDVQAVFDVTEERAGGVARVDVLGDADDRVDLGGSNFALTGTVTEDGTAFAVYSDGNAQLRVEDGVQVVAIPVFTSPAVARAAENQVAAYEAAAADADGDPLSYSLSGTDAALFTIDANTGAVSFRAAPDFEAPGDADGDNVYDIIVTASDGANQTDQSVAITVTNENDNVPAFTSPATVSVAENQVAAYEAAAGDADGGPLRYSLSGTDAALFKIEANTGVVSFRAAPDFEAPGDDDGDNVYDIIVTASDGTNQTDQSVAITVTDGYRPIPLSSLDGTNGFILNGIDARDQSGRSVSSAGDVNGDGYDDLIIGAPGAAPNGGSSGETYIVYGGANAPGTDGVLDLSTLDGTNGFTLTGISELDDSGISVSSAGDVNGDGYDDLIIGASGVGNVQGEYDRFPGPGEAYVVYGGATGADLVLDRSTLDGTRGFALTGIDDGDELGLPVSSAGDVNGDGYDDLIISANEASPNGDSEAGETYVVYGGASAPGTEGVLDLSDLDGINGFILNGIDEYDYSGWSASSAGDVNGDGYDDLIIGAYGGDRNEYTNAGETYVIYGGANAPGTDGELDLSALDGRNGFILNGIDADDYSGRSVSSAGDVNGDGYDDLIIGARDADPNGHSRAGETYVVYGGASAPGTGGRFNLSALDGTNGFILNGIDEDDLSGWSVSSAGDVNGDGYDDLIIGARDADPNGHSNAGETYIVYGGANAPGTGGELDLSALDGTNGFILTGVDMFDNTGFSVSSAGDVNGDGYDDLIIGAYGGDPNGDSNAGETYVVYGGATGTESVVPVTAQGTAAVDNFTGNAGADSFTGIATDDVVRGGASDDVIRVTALDFAAVDGGTGRDTLILDGSGLSLDLTGAGHASVDSVEVFDLSGTGSNTLVLDAQAVFDVTEERAGGVASVDVLGDADDRVDLGGSNFALTGTVTEDDTAFTVYSDGNAQVRVETGMQVQIPVSTPPAFTSPATVSVAENQVAAYEAAAADADGAPLSYSLSGTDAALFTIEANTGAVSFRAAPDFEAPGDDDGDNVYDIIVTASDGANQTDQSVAITVTNENEALVFTSPATARVAENQVAAYEAAAADADGDPLSYSLSGTDAALFTIDANTGEVSFRAAPDFEVPGDDDGDNVYDIIVTASDDAKSTEQPVAITVTNENDNPPAFTSPATVSVAENQVAAYEAAAADADGDPLSYSLSGTDTALFTIAANTGEVSFRAAPDFKAPGDADGDNVYDIIVTASDGTNSTDQSVAITVTDEYDPIPLSSLNGSNGFALTGIDALDSTGRSVSSAGDVNGDGYDDLIIGAPGADPNGHSNAGETYIVYGGANAPGTDGVLDLSTLDGTNGFTLTGISELDDSGISVSSAGDVNGDGYDDLIIGASGVGNVQGEYDRFPGPGEAYVVYGGATGVDLVLDRSTLDGTRGFALTGIDDGDELGLPVSSAGDVNGDGYDDLIISANEASPNGDSLAGETYVVYGGASAPGTGGVLDLSTLDSTSGLILNGIDEDDQSGTSVSSAGDVNGDGYDDLIIGAYGGDPNEYTNAGETYVIYGGANAPGTGGELDLSALDGRNGFILNGIDRLDRSGGSVSSAGDVNGDGYDDLIIGAYNADPNGDSRAGETYVVYGGASAPGTGGRFNLSALDGTNGFILNGIDEDDLSGWSVSSAGDVNGDGYDDLIIGARDADPNEDSAAGETYVVYGGASAPGTGGRFNLSALDGTNGFILTGVDMFDNTGFSVSSAGDVNGDGYDDLIIGAYGGDPNGDSNAGETYVVYGGATGTESVVPVTAQGTAAVDNFTGNAGADSFTGIATDDVVRGGAGDDNTSVTALDFAAVDGGTGQDTLILNGAGLSLDLTGAGHASVDSVEVFDLSGTGSNTLVLDAQAVFDVTEERAGGVASVDVLGDADDRVDLGGSNFITLTGTVTEEGTTFAVYSDGNAQVRVEDGVGVTLAGSMGAGAAFGANGDGDPERIEDRDASGLSVRLDEDTDGDGDVDLVTYEGDADFVGNFPNNIGLEVVRLDGLDGDGSTDLTIPDEFVFAGNPTGNQVRIEGGSTDTLRFDMDDFAEAQEAVGFRGESYRSFASDDQMWAFLVDADVMLFDI